MMACVCGTLYAGYVAQCRACMRMGCISGSHRFDRWTLTELRILAANLAIGAALCRADRNGCNRGMRTGLLSGPNTWRPGCGKAAP